MGIKSLRTVVVAGLAAGVAFAFLPAAAVTGTVAVSNAADHVISHTKSAQESSNWSGYAETGSYTSATGTWTVPTVSGSGNHYSSQWVGIDGYSNSNLIQTGTEADVVGGRATYDAWWEILPASETVISGFSVSPGNSITGTVSKVSGTTWKITLVNNSTGASFSTTKTYRGSGSSAEWIEEATDVNGTIGTPPKFSTFSFTNLTSNGANPGLVSSEEILLEQNGVVYSTPSAPSGGNSFSVSYTG
jgi:hypothetical protein